VLSSFSSIFLLHIQMVESTVVTTEETIPEITIRTSHHNVLDATVDMLRKKFGSANNSKNPSRTQSRNSSRNSSRNTSRSNSTTNSSEEDSGDDSGGSTTLKPRHFVIEAGSTSCDTHPELLDGVMKRHGGVLGNWHERYFVFKAEEKQIWYYKEKRHFLEKRKPRGIIDLHGASAKRKNDDEDREHVFVIFYPQDIHKEIQHLQGSCDQQITHWINTINELSEEEL